MRRTNTTTTVLRTRFLFCPSILLTLTNAAAVTTTSTRTTSSSSSSNNPTPFTLLSQLPIIQNLLPRQPFIIPKVPFLQPGGHLDSFAVRITFRVCWGGEFPLAVDVALAEDLLGVDTETKSFDCFEAPFSGGAVSFNPYVVGSITVSWGTGPTRR